MRLSGRTVVLTGAAGGIGAACARRYATEGAVVVCVDRGEAVHRLTDELAGLPGRAVGVAADISTADGNAAAVRVAMEETGRLDVFHANAAVQVVAPFEETRLEDWDRMERVNLRGVFLGVRSALDPLKASGHGSIIFTSSVLGLVGDAGLGAYGAMKGGLVAMAKSLAASHGSAGIRCNTICPADIETEMVREYFDSLPDPAHARAEIERQYPVGRLGRPEDIAAAAAFLASDDAAFISGIDLVVDGGLLARIY
ncbi:SDR family NAD(P)-dependent oxidoreductase [Streptomyces sp. NPDC020917]|uniref:SDR family NAD(P)-dependent oxidoreductase n=1 Tax=Streptomyces sp. NPDC020917 TaxID=3365102 RepID=UPI0037960569